MWRARLDSNQRPQLWPPAGSMCVVSMRVHRFAATSERRREPASDC